MENNDYRKPEFFKKTKLLTGFKEKIVEKVLLIRGSFPVRHFSQILKHMNDHYLGACNLLNAISSGKRILVLKPMESL